MHTLRLVSKRAMLATALAGLLVLIAACSVSGASSLTAEEKAGKVVLTWQDISTDETAFVIYRAIDTGTAGADFNLLAEVPADTTTYRDGNVKAGTKYRYYVTSKSELRESAPSNIVTVTVSTNPSTNNTAPTANAGADQTVAPNTAVVLDGSKSRDNDGDSLTYQWELTEPSGSAATLKNSRSVKATFTPDVAGEYIATLTVSDGTLTAKDSVKITVTDGANTNTAPIADAGTDQTAAPNTVVTLDGSKSKDNEGDSLTYQWELTKPSGSTSTLTNPRAAKATFTPDVVGEYTATLTVSDGTLTANDSVKVTVAEVECNTVRVNEGSIWENTTWAGQKGCVDYKISGEIRIYANLRIMPDVTVEFEPSASLNISSSGKSMGSITAIGTPSSPITFTGKDKIAGSWGDGVGIYFDRGNGSSNFEHVNISYAKTGISTSASFQGDLTLKNVAINNSSDGGFYAGSSNAKFTISNSTVSKNGYGVSLEAVGASSSISNNTFSGNSSGDVSIHPQAIPYFKANNTIADEYIYVKSRKTISSEITIPAGLPLLFSGNTNSDNK